MPHARREVLAMTGVFTGGPVYVPVEGRQLAEHELAAHHWVVTRLGCRLVREGRYMVPSDTLSVEQAYALGIQWVDQFFGGIVPFPFVGTKLISHPLVAMHASAPKGWRHQHPHRLAGLVVPGWGAFSVNDLHEAAARLLDDGAVRLKLGEGRGGGQQWVVADLASLKALLEEEAALAAGIEAGVVVERDLRHPVTLSVGHVILPTLSLSYLGYQREARDRHGVAHYGGSRLCCVRGSFSMLLDMLGEPNERLAVEQARAYHDAMFEAFPELVISRANYDVIQGFDAHGHWHSGVLEQSWRIGGASPAEILAAEMLSSGNRHRVDTSYVERYEANATAPDGAEVIYRAAVDPGDAPALTYVEVPAS
jgi:hypothetical protein